MAKNKKIIPITFEYYLPLREVASHLNMSAKTLHSWVEKGYIEKAIRVGNTYAVPRDYRISKEAFRVNLEALQSRLK
jgi:predicted site-specific integrase-resolvase